MDDINESCPSCADNADPAFGPSFGNPNLFTRPYTPPTAEDLESSRQYYAARLDAKNTRTWAPTESPTEPQMASGGNVSQLRESSANPIEPVAMFRIPSTEAMPPVLSATWHDQQQGWLVPDITNLPVHTLASPTISRRSSGRLGNSDPTNLYPTIKVAIQTGFRHAMFGEDAPMPSQLAAPWHEVDTGNATSDPVQQAEDIPDPPKPPEEPASEDDCAKWIKEYGEWLRKHGEYIESPVVLKCRNTRFEFNGEGDRWMLSEFGIREEMNDKFIRESGTPANDEWKDPNAQQADEWWVNTARAEENLKDANGQIIKRDITGSDGCKGKVIRRTDDMHSRIEWKFSFSRAFIVADDNGSPSQHEIDHHKVSMERWLKDALAAVAGEGAATITSELLMPPESVVLAAFNNLGLRIKAGRALKCTEPCILATKIVGWSKLRMSRFTPEELKAQGLSNSTKVREVARAKTGRYWTITFTGSFIGYAKADAELDYDVYCERR